ncbi:MAG: family 10 glycosylhydrolase [Melioribacteraceae bacterium]
MNKLKILLILYIFISISVFAQIPRETRAVWLTTNLKLDWPPNTTDEEYQKKLLRDMFRNLKEKNFNTVYFQVRSNGTVMYKSDIEPFSPYITGTVGKIPSYDPLQYAIDLGREFNLEVHAWINMIRCFTGSDERIAKHPKHLRSAHSNWVVKYSENGSTSYWLNPGIDQVQNYLADLMIELTSKYDVDGIHLDFFRYPGSDFSDDKFFRSSASKTSKDDWRRNNLTSILRKFKENANPVNPYLKVGVTPIGIRKNLKGATGWEGYSSVYQDSETWLKEELVDYLTPQIYWGFDKNPHFDILAKDWVDKSYNKNIVLGLAAYKEDVIPQLNKMIDFSRKVGAAGVSFFRYEHIDNKLSYYNDVAFPPNMPWKILDNSEPAENLICEFEEISPKEVMLSWDNNHALKIPNQIRFYVLYDNTDVKTIARIISLDKRQAKLKFSNPSKLAFNYNIGKIDRLWNEVNFSTPVLVKVPFLEKLKEESANNIHPILIKQSEEEFLLSIHSFEKQKVIVGILTKENTYNEIEFDFNLGENIIKLSENIKFIKSIKINFDNDKREELINLI